MARSAAARIITHLAQASGPQTRASTTMPTASKKRQKHNFMISISFSKRFSSHMKKDIKVQAQKSIRERNFSQCSRALCLGLSFVIRIVIPDSFSSAVPWTANPSERINRLLSFLDSLYGALDQAVSGFEGDLLFITLAEREWSDPDSRDFGMGKHLSNRRCQLPACRPLGDGKRVSPNLCFRSIKVRV